MSPNTNSSSTDMLENRGTERHSRRESVSRNRNNTNTNLSTLQENGHENSESTNTRKLAPSFPRDPPFLQKKIQRFQDKLRLEWNNEPVLQGNNKMLDKDSILVCSNDYLSMIGEEHLLQLQAKSIFEGSLKALSSPVYMFGQKNNPIIKFEENFASFLHAEDGIAAQSGFAANSALIQSLTGPTVPVYMDVKSHASALAGAKLSNAPFFLFKHNNVASASKLMRVYGPGVLIVESVYSTDGSQCPLEEFVQLAEEYKCAIVVDESHSFGTHGPDGRGLVVEHGLESRVTFRTASLSKAFAGRAGFITCSSEFKKYLMTDNYPMMFSSCLQYHDAAWLQGVLDLLPLVEDRRQKLREMSVFVRQEFEDMGFNVSSGTDQIIALTCKTEVEALKLDRMLQDKGVFGSLFLPPAAPKDAPFVRISLNTGLKDDQIDRVLKASAQVYKEMYCKK